MSNKLSAKHVYLVASGDLRQSANETWPGEAAMEKKLRAAVSGFGYRVVRPHHHNSRKKHGLIASQREGLNVFSRIDPSAPPAHHIGGWAGSDSHRQPAMYFRLGGGSLRGIAKPGEIVWSRIFVEGSRLKMDIGRAQVVELPQAEMDRRWRETTYPWPIMHAVTYGVSRDQMMARHKANHIQVAYAHSASEADLVLYAKAAFADKLGIEVSVCGTKADGGIVLGGQLWAESASVRAN